MQKRDESALETPPTRRLIGAAAVAAVFASACCLGPLILAALGISAAGFAARLEPVRPFLLILTIAFLGAGFYLAYFRKPACGPDGTCAAGDEKRVRRSRALLWLATVFVALLALFPLYGGSLLRAGAPEDAAAGSSLVETVRLRVEGMSCDACAASIETSLRAVPGVVSASVSYTERTAVVAATKGARPPASALIEAVGKAGYEAMVIEEEQAREVSGGAHLFDITFRYAADVEPPAPVGEADGRLVGSGTGSVSGERVKGEIRWSNFERAVGEGVCALKVPGEIRTDDGAVIRFEAVGHALVPDKAQPNRWQTALTVRFETNEERYAWLRTVLGLWEGEFDMKTGTARAQVYAHGRPDPSRARVPQVGGQNAAG